MCGPIDIGSMICDELCNLGFDAWTDKDGAYSQADVVIMPTDSVALELMRDRKISFKQDVVTVLWLVDPLPPPDVTARSDLIGQRIANLDWRIMFPGRPGQIIHKYFPFGRDVMRLGRWVYIRKLRKEFKQSGTLNYLDCPNREWVRVMVRGYRFRYHNRDNHIDYLFAMTKPMQQFLAGKGIDIDFVPVGYHPAFGENLRFERDIDVLFLGKINSRRRAAILHKLNGELTAENVKLKIVDKDCYGDERTQLLNRTTISLDLPRVPWDFGAGRFLMSMSCGALVVSEGNCPKEPYIKDVHYVQAKDSDLTTTILSYLRNEQQRCRIARDAYNYVKKEITLKKSVLDILQKSNLVDTSQLHLVEK
jgi:hypothetical protein